ncbi:hypothetical protein ONZ45_g11687 [Pleurotus djamor]|nr:hypothetical protein ONZ45_g11687 [Pleurotus djamor]
MKHRKSKEVELEQKEEAKEAVLEMLAQCDDELSTKNNPHAAELMRLKDELSESLASSDDAYEEQVSSKRWEDITSANSLADVAKLHCGIHMSKAIRNDFMKLDSDAILAGITDYLSYCANDVSVTHAVFSRVLPAFLQSCPHPVSFAGILTMGSSFLCVNQEWEKYLENAEKTYRDMAETVKSKLLHLAEEAKRLAVDSSDEKPWLSDPWLSQLDWTPKVAGITRGVMPPPPSVIQTLPKPLPVIVEVGDEPKTFPAWFAKLVKDPLCAANRIKLLPILLRFEYDGYPMLYTKQDLWHYMKDGEVHRLPTTSGGLKMTTMLSRKHVLPGFASGRLTSRDPKLATDLTINGKDPELAVRVVEYAQGVLDEFGSAGMHDPSLSQLDWKLMEVHANTRPRKAPQIKPKAKPKSHTELWPKWYWDATAPKKGCPPGTLDITVRSFIAPLLLRLSWLGHPLFKSREHGWTFRVPAGVEFTTRSSPVTFYDPADDSLAEMALSGGYVFYKLPHKDGEKANVGNPLSKPFMKFAQDGTLKGSDGTAAEALDVNAQCSYWISARDRVLGQMVVWQQKKRDLGIAPKPTKNQKWGIIIPQVITMGTVTRRAIEKTWLTASNAKKNRVGSELKALVRAPPGYAIVGADVDSEELWISSCMGDAQFGLHGATALGWMTLEGTKAAGTDLHSKTANILGISRDQAKVFNYSRIYGAGMRHAILLLLQSNAEMLPEQAQKLAENLYASTKGKNTHRTDIFGRKFWFGGTESFVFNKLEEIALSAKPETPALGCGVTHALSKEFLPSDFGADYMPSRINWVVQSSGVDYLHLLIVSMDHLIQKYDIQARYLISVHDEVRYLVKEEDKYRVALALQIANLWTRSLFAMKLGMSDLPQGVAFFSAVDVDHVLRKEVDLPCVTPSQPIPIPPGESLTIQTVLEKTHGGSLWSDGRPMSRDVASVPSEFNDFVMPDCLSHRAASAAFLQAQSTTDFEEIKHLAKLVSGTEVKGGIGEGARPKMKRGRKPKAAPLAASVDMDPSLADEEFKRCKHLD